MMYLQSRWSLITAAHPPPSSDNLTFSDNSFFEFHVQTGRLVNEHETIIQQLHGDGGSQREYEDRHEQHVVPATRASCRRCLTTHITNSHSRIQLSYIIYQYIVLPHNNINQLTYQKAYFYIISKEYWWC